MRIALAANPGSGSDTDRDGIARRLRERDVEVVDAEAPAERLAIAGGDGTVGVAAALAARRGIPLAVLPTGTANDFARALGIPLDLDEAVALAADPEADERTIDLAWLEPANGGERRVFLNAASAGLSPYAAGHADGLKARLGPLAYAVGALRAGFTAPPVACRVRADGEEVFAGKAWSVNVAGTGAFGGGSSVGGADPGDGRLDVVAAPARSRAGLVRLAWGMRTGRLADQSHVSCGRGRRIEVVADDPQTPFNVDGELVEGGSIACTVEPGAVRVVCP